MGNTLLATVHMSELMQQKSPIWQIHPISGQ